MIKDRPNKVLKWLGDTFIEPWILRHFTSVKFIGELNVKQDHSSVLLMNHFSLNDGAVLNRICRTILKKNLRAMSIESQIKAMPILSYFGCFSVSNNSRDMIESLNYAASLLKDPNIMLGMYPQGNLHSMHLNKIHFKGGLGYIFKRTQKIQIQVFFSVVLLDYLENYKPIARVYLHEYSGERNTDFMEEAYNQFYRECKLKHQRLYNPPEKVIDIAG